MGICICKNQTISSPLTNYIVDQNENENQFEQEVFDVKANCEKGDRSHETTTIKSNTLKSNTPKINSEKNTFKIKHNQSKHKLSLSIIHLNKKESNDFLIYHRMNSDIIDSKHIQKYATKFEEEISNKKRYTDTTISFVNFDTNVFTNPNKINIILVGDKHVGKSAFAIRLSKNYYEKLYIPTFGVESYSKKIIYNGRQYHINFIVLPGESRYHDDYAPLFKKANFIFLFYDTSKEGSFNKAKSILYNGVSKYAWIFQHRITNFFFVGNKIDISPRVESHEKIDSFCKKHHFEFYEISVKEGKGVNAFINTILEKYNAIVY